MRRLCAALAAVATFATCDLAWADGDPASDVLLSQDVFTPYAPRVSAPVAKALTRVVKAAGRAGWPVKVALIEQDADLGAYPQLFDEPQRYADLLAVELSFNRKPRILTVMPAGFGGTQLGPGARGLADRVAIDRAARSDGLALAAARAVAELSTAAGHPVETGALPAAATARGSGRSSPLATAALFLGPVLLLAAAGAVATLRARRRDARGIEG